MKHIIASTLIVLLQGHGSCCGQDQNANAGVAHDQTSCTSRDLEQLSNYVAASGSTAQSQFEHCLTAKCRSEVLATLPAGLQKAARKCFETGNKTPIDLFNLPASTTESIRRPHQAIESAESSTMWHAGVDSPWSVSLPDGVFPARILSFFHEKYQSDGVCRQWETGRWQTVPCGRKIQEQARVQQVGAPQGQGIQVVIDGVRGIVVPSEGLWERFDFFVSLDKKLELSFEGYYSHDGNIIPGIYQGSFGESKYSASATDYFNRITAELVSYLRQRKR